MLNAMESGTVCLYTVIMTRQKVWFYYMEKQNGYSTMIIATRLNE